MTAQMNDRFSTSQTNTSGHANPVGYGNIIQLVKAEGGSTIRDVVQHVFVGDYERLRDAYIHPWPVFSSGCGWIASSGVSG